ncbi:choice-of-anchor L domain-containing protein [Reinekea marina]|uniref:Choice-of-anchor L domain-containing protein n=1 Tax=Reinekea marina TaxID=1310421 RepID=A0ABV7WTL3_9GAMM|nr:choice-of-anchor L domain-containing protein [Reinekea marina]MDN3648817.1 choice-of-anchor L domain-containing protein [Reinekea marina]
MDELRPSLSMRLVGYIGLLMFFLAPLGYSETVVSKNGSTVTNQDIVDSLVGSEISIDNYQLLGKNVQFGLFSDYQFLFGDQFDRGLVLSTGKVTDVIAVKNTSDKVSTIFDKAKKNDIDLGSNILDPAKLSISFKPKYDYLVIDFIFGSEEYNEYVHAKFNDSFVILVNGENCAKTPDNKIFSIDTVNDRANYPPVYGEAGPSSNPELYLNNDPGHSYNSETGAKEESKAPYATQMDGFTRKIRCVAEVTPNTTNQIVIGIMDKGDAQYDSWAFIRANSLSSTVYLSQFDADHDGIADYIEGTVDSDSDGIPDYLDTDSDNDGIPDTLEDFDSPKLLGFDHDNDGIVDALDVDKTNGVDQNQNGIDDLLEPTDTDKDGVPDHLDLDSDNDGILDSIESGHLPVLSGLDTDEDGLDDAIDVDQTGGLDENNDGVDDGFSLADSDKDGMPDMFDLDSDNDGIPDSVEFQGNTKIDADLDGVIDVFVDLNKDGVADSIPLAAKPVNTDKQGVPDYLDLDSDNDGLTDLHESLPIGMLLEALDADENGQINSTIDRDHDGLLDVVDSRIEGGEAGVSVYLIDIDNDGLPAYRDVDTDGDGFSDDVENGDFNNDGINDRLQKMPALKTAVSGVGIGSFGAEYFLLIPLLMLFRKKVAG